MLLNGFNNGRYFPTAKRSAASRSEEAMKPEVVREWAVGTGQPIMKGVFSAIHFTLGPHCAPWTRNTTGKARHRQPGKYLHLTPPCKRGHNTTPRSRSKPGLGIGPWGGGTSAPPGIGPSDPACPAWRCRKPCQARNRHRGGFGHARTASGRPGRVWNS